MAPDSRKLKHAWSGTLQSLAVGVCVFYLGRELALWLTVRNVHGFWGFLDNLVAGIAAGLLVLVYERRRQRAVDKLRESEQRFRVVADSAPTLIWMSGTDKLCTYFNKPWLDFTGRSMEQELGNGWTEGVHPEDSQRCLDTYMQSFDRQEEFEMEYRLRRHDGEYRWVFDTGVPRFNQDRSFAGYIGSLVDITERKLAEQERLLSENRFRQFFETMPEYCYVVSSNGEIIDVNPAACSAFGYQKDELVGKPISTLYAPECHSKVSELFTRWKTDGKLRNEEMVVITKEGQRRTVLLNVGSVKDSDGNILHSTSVQVDITERKLAEQALHASEERLRLAQQAARIGTFEWNIQTGVNTWTPELERMYDLPPGGFGKTQPAFENLVHPDDRAKVINLVDSAFKSGQPVEGEWRVVWGDGSVHWIVGRWQVFTNESSEAVRMIGVNLDITERKRAEEALAGMTRKLIEAQEQERARIGRELHDDINQRLALLAIKLEQVQDSPSDFLSRVQELQEEVSEISSDVHAMSHEMHASKLEYLGVVAGMKSWCKEFGGRQEIDVDFRPDVRSPVPSDIGLCLFRVLQEALHNAAKHSGAKRIEVQLHEELGEIHLTIRDSGKGFDIEAARNGRGLGLTSMQERVRLVNGTMTIQSKPMAGTTIHARVPLESAQVRVKTA